MRRNPLLAASFLLVVFASGAFGQSVELGVQSCRLIDLTPTDSFTLGATSSFMVDAGVPGLEGYFVTVWQEYAPWDNLVHSIPGIGGGLFINEHRPYHIFLQGGPMTGGANPGQSVTMQFTWPTTPSLLGAQFVVQGYVVNWNSTQQNFTTALVGTIR